jgi:hypothetical protein
MIRIMQMEMLNVAILIPRDVGDDSNVNRLNASCASHGVAQFVIHSQFASRGPGVANVHNVEMATY